MPKVKLKGSKRKIKPIHIVIGLFLFIAVFFSMKSEVGKQVNVLGEEYHRPSIQVYDASPSSSSSIANEKPWPALELSKKLIALLEPLIKQFMGQVLQMKQDQEYYKDVVQYESVISRSEEERQKAIESIRVFAENNAVNPIYEKTIKSECNWDLSIEVYKVDKSEYQVDPRTNKVVAFHIPGMIGTVVDSVRAQVLFDSFEIKAREFIKSKSGVNVKEYPNSQHHYNTDGEKRMTTNYSFEWLDTSRRIKTGYPGIGVSYTSDGAVTDFHNTLDF